jgi:hypothetical protein
MSNLQKYQNIIAININLSSSFSYVKNISWRLFSLDLFRGYMHVVSKSSWIWSLKNDVNDSKMSNVSSSFPGTLRLFLTFAALNTARYRLSLRTEMLSSKVNS